MVLFVLFGWIWKRTRLAHLITVGLVAGSWFVLGIWYGIGYCPFTDWHWQVRLKLGYDNYSSSYIHFLITSLTGITIRKVLVDVLLVIGLVVSTAASVILFFRGGRKRRRF